MPWIVPRVRLKVEGVYSPSGATVEVSDLDRAALVPSHARDATEAEIAAAAPGHTDLMLSPEAIEAALSGLTPAEIAEIDADPETASENRVSDIKDAIDLLDAADFAEGQPDAGKLAEILGYEATADEVAAAIALREAF